MQLQVIQAAGAPLVAKNGAKIYKAVQDRLVAAMKSKNAQSKEDKNKEAKANRKKVAAMLGR